MRLLPGLLVAGLLAACGSVLSPNPPDGPYASPPPTPPVAVIRHGCARVGTGNNPSPDVTFVKLALTRQGTDLDRIRDDLSGAVPGGDFAVDTGILRRDADGLKQQIETSTLCEPLRDNLDKQAGVLLDADVALAGTGGGEGAAAALQKARDAYNALVAITQSAAS